MKSLLVFCLVCIISTTMAQQQYLLIGTYTNAKSEGIYVYDFNTQNADNNFISVAKSSNPSFLAISPNQKFVYAVNENNDSSKYFVGGNISAFNFNNNTGQLSEINKQPSGGKHPCYVAIDKTGKWIFAGNYTSGSIGVLPANDDGSLLAPLQIIEHHGKSINTDRQTGPHVHSTNFSANNKFLFVPDLGIDKVMIYSFNNASGKLKYKSEAASLPGSGPRHMAFDTKEKFTYLVEELTGTVVCYKIKKSKLIFVERVNALAPDFKGDIGSADIHISPDGKFLYCSNRGESNTISIFSINQKNGKLSLITQQPTLGKTPRNFSIDPSGNFLLVAHQNSDNIVIFKIDKQTGLLTDTGKRINVANPVCIKWIEKK